MPKNQVFCLRSPGTNDPEWKVAFNGEVMPVESNSKGAAEIYLDSLERKGKEKRNFERMK